MKNDRAFLAKYLEKVVKIMYTRFEFLFDETEEELIKKTHTKYLDSGMSIEEINREISIIVDKKQEEYNKKHNPDLVKENHKYIYSKLESLISLLNKEKIDYYLCGALCGYIKYGEESKRVHDDIDILINENDIEKFGNICEKMNLYFSDRRFDSPRVLKGTIPSGEHEIIATDDNNLFHIGAFAFQRLADGSMITKGYYKSESNIPYCREEIMKKCLVDIIYSKKPINFMGHDLYITAPEYIYSLKRYTNNSKDKEDLAFLKNKINQNTLNSIISMKSENSFVQHFKVEKPLKTDDNEINKMLDNVDSDIKTSDDKQLTKNDSQTGSISLFSIGLSILIITGMVLIALILNLLLK